MVSLDRIGIKRSMRRAMSGVAGLLILASGSFGAVLTTEDQIRKAVIGNTVAGVEDGKAYTEYFQPDGYLHGEDPEGPYVGEWRIAGRDICTRDFSEEHSMSDWECVSVDIDGSRFAWVKDGERYEAQLRHGNPNKL